MMVAATLGGSTQTDSSRPLRQKGTFLHILTNVPEDLVRGFVDATEDERGAHCRRVLDDKLWAARGLF